MQRSVLVSMKDVLAGFASPIITLNPEDDGNPRRFHQQPVGMQQQQSSLAATVLGILAACWVDADAATPVYRSQRGFSSAAIVRNSAGNYTLTLQDAISTTADVLITCGCNNSALGIVTVNLASTTTLTALMATTTVVPAIAAADIDFWVKVEQFGPA